MASRYQNFIKGIGLVPNAVDENAKKGDLNVVSGDGKLYYHNGTSSSPSVTEVHASQGANRLKNKDLEDATTAIVDSSDTTKKIVFDAAGSTGTSTTLLSSQTGNRVLTLPDATDTLVGTATSDILTNKTIAAGSNTISGLTNANLSGTAGITNANLANSTISGISLGSNLADLTAGTGLVLNSGTTYNGGTAKTISIDSSVVTLTGSQVLTNKTLTSPVLNTPTADTITGIVGGAFTLQSASNQNVNIQAQGSGLVQIENYTFNASTLSTVAGVGMIIAPSAGSITMASSPPMSGGGAIIFGTRAAFDTEVLLTSGTAVTVSTNNSHVSFRGAGLVSIAGFVSNKTGEVIYIDNNTGSPITILNDSASASANDRILTGTGDDLILENGATIAIIYSGYAVSRWMVVGGTGGGAVTVSILAGENLAAGDAVYISQGVADGGRTAGRAYKLDATNDNRIDFIGFATKAISSGSSGRAQVIGEFLGFSGLTSGLPVYASVTTPGSYQTSTPTVGGQWIIQLGTATATTKLSINGSGSATASKIAQFSGAYVNRSSVSSNTILTNNSDAVLVSAASGAVSITLPSPSNGKLIYVKKTDSTSNAVNIIPSGVDTIDGNPRYSLLGQYDTVQMVSDGTNWFII